jgi:hypothetical protein
MAPNTERRKRFKAGLALIEKTQSAFAREHSVTLTHLQQVLLGLRTSQRLNAEIDTVIALVPTDATELPEQVAA